MKSSQSSRWRRQREIDTGILSLGKKMTSCCQYLPNLDGLDIRPIVGQRSKNRVVFKLIMGFLNDICVVKTNANLPECCLQKEPVISNQQPLFPNSLAAHFYTMFPTNVWLNYYPPGARGSRLLFLSTHPEINLIVFKIPQWVKFCPCRRCAFKKCAWCYTQQPGIVQFNSIALSVAHPSALNCTM